MSDRVVVETVSVGMGGDRDLLADLYVPPHPNGAAVLLVHGGGFTGGDRSQLRGYGILLGRVGYTCLACEYRLAPEHKWPAQLDDVSTALAYLFAQAPRLDVDTAKIAVSGNSAGGCLALLVAGASAERVAVVVSIYPPVDFVDGSGVVTERPGLMGYLLGEDVSEPRRRSLSPLYSVTKNFPPTLLITGNGDEVVPWRESLHLYERLIELRVPAELHVFEGLPHAFDQVPAYGRQTANLIQLFLDRHLLNAASQD
jgi:acetyl esterase/lipase